MPATASTAATVDRRMAQSMPRGEGCGQVIAGRRVAVGAEPAADCSGRLCLRVGSEYRTQVGPGETGIGHGLLLRDRLGGIWEAASGVNCPEPGPTELKQSV